MKWFDQCSLIQNSCLDPRATHTYYFAVLLPSLSYTLPVSHYSNQALDTVDQPLGKWLFPGPKLRRTWPYYYDPDSRTLWCRTMDDQAFTVHHSVSSSTLSSHPTSFCHQSVIQPLLATMILPENTVPVQCTKTWNTIDSIQVRR
jgi:hypothetical protein